MSIQFKKKRQPVNPWKGVKGLSRDLWIIYIATLINRSGTMVLPFLALYLTSDLHEDAATAGMILTCYGLGSLITAPVMGKLSDKIGSITIMKLSLFFSGCILIFYPFIKGFTLLFAVTLLWAVINEAFRPAVMSLISYLAPREKRRVAFSMNRLIINLGMSIGPVAAGFLARINFSIIFYVDAITAMLAAAFLTFYPIHYKINKEVIEKEVEEFQSHKGNVLKDLRFMLFLLALTPATMVIFQHLGAYPLYLVKDLHFQTSTFGMLTAVNTVMIIFIEVPLNTAMSAWSEKKSMALGAFLIGTGFGITALVSDVIPLIISIVIWTFGEMILFPTSSTFAAEISPPNRRGEYMGYFQMTFSLALTLGPWLGTLIYSTFGGREVWFAAFIVGTISTAAMLMIPEKSVVSKPVN
ncbi:MAG TPA: MFS transporter [Ignavibacteriaceae bacterium]|nr:MFS transporter [Ignavibacteriaceae bacterium]